MSSERIYRRTDAGNHAWKTQDRNVPVEYRRILEIVGNGAHEAVIRTSLREFPAQEVSEWLANVEELGLIESAPGGAKDDLDFTGNFRISEIRAGLEKLAAANKRK
jgi:hypothetical protein